MAIPTPWEEFIRELQGRPYSLIALLVLLWSVPYTYVDSARAQDYRQVHDQLSDIHRQNKEAELAATERELFQLQQQVNDKLAGKKPVDAVYYSRINALTIEKGRLERELQSGH